MNIDSINGQIKEFAEENLLGRNEFLQSLLAILMFVKDGVVIDLDGPWGSGKTVLAKQLELLCSDDDFTLEAIDNDLSSKFRNEYTVFYYNVWENDE